MLVEPDLDDEAVPRDVRADAQRIERILDGAVEGAKWARPADAIDLSDTVRWRPHLVGSDLGKKQKLLHVQLTDALLPFLVERLRLAHEAGWEVHLVVDEGSLHAREFVGKLEAMDVVVHLLRGDAKFATGVDLLATLGERGAALPRAERVKLAESAWKRRREGRRSRRGRRLEGLLAFLFGQVQGLRVVERNLRTATEEIDIVLQCECDVARPWYESGVPFVLVESKNWRNKVGAPEVSSFIVKVQGKRGRCRIGILCSATGFSGDAKNQELRLAATREVIVMIGPKEILEWIRSEDPTRWLDQVVRRAMLR